MQSSVQLPTKIPYFSVLYPKEMRCPLWDMWPRVVNCLIRFGIHNYSCISKLIYCLLYIQAAHPYFNRVSYSEGARYYSEGAYMASHHWDKVVIMYKFMGESTTSMFTANATDFDQRQQSSYSCGNVQRF